LKDWTAAEQRRWRQQRIDSFEKGVTEMEADYGGASAAATAMRPLLQKDLATELDRMFNDRMGLGYINTHVRGEVMVLSHVFCVGVWNPCKAALAQVGRKPRFDYRHQGSWARRDFSLVVELQTTLGVLKEIFGEHPFRDRRFYSAEGRYNDDPTQGPLAGGLLRLGETVKLRYNVETQRLRIFYSYLVDRWELEDGKAVLKMLW